MVSYSGYAPSLHPSRWNPVPLLSQKRESQLLTVLGWAFNLDGKLAKAPKFDETKDFNKDDYSLFAIHTHVDKAGFIWVNFDSSETPIPWEELNAGTDEQARLQDFPIDNYVYHRTWTTNGKYNWKLVGDNYNEVSITSGLSWLLLSRSVAFRRPGIQELTIDYLVLPLQGKPPRHHKDHQLGPIFRRRA